MLFYSQFGWTLGLGYTGAGYPSLAAANAAVLCPAPGNAQQAQQVNSTATSLAGFTIGASCVLGPLDVAQQVGVNLIYDAGGFTSVVGYATLGAALSDATLIIGSGSFVVVTLLFNPGLTAYIPQQFLNSLSPSSTSVICGASYPPGTSPFPINN
jgi:hypothetical protein